MTQEINRYITEVDKSYRDGNATEHTYRPALKKLLESITTGLDITNEPKHIECGAPDYIITRGSIPLGYIEAKDITVGLSNKANKTQFDRYRQSLGNLVITDYLTFQLYVEGDYIAQVTIAREEGGKITPDKKQYEAFLALINQFIGYAGKTICQSLDLARMMAAKAKLLAEIIKTALADKENSKTGNDTVDDGDILFAQLQGFREILIKNLSVDSFADMYAQTLAYGLFAARLNQRNAKEFNREIAAHLIPHSNPFLRKFFHHIAFDLDSRIIWIVDALANLFNSVAVEDILKEFGRANQDPYIHFYETFLAEYNPALRESRGVYYTPLPAVRFIVKAVDGILKKEFNLKEGLADNSRIKLPVKSKDKQGNQITGEREFHKVQILDPATGTGTFLAEAIHTIYAAYANQQGMWGGYCEKHLVPRIHGFEILMASYAMAHFKLDMTLKETGFDSRERLNIYLTNSLEEAPERIPELFMARWLAQEAEDARRIKQDVPVMVVMGNPPYNVSTQNKNEWIDSLIADYKQGLAEKNIQPLSDDYIKFIRYGQYLIEKNASGILAYISNNSFIDGLIHRQMRKIMLDTFDKIYILDLHGSAIKKETSPDGGKDENVFDIQQGTSINIFIKKGGKKAGKSAEVYHSDLFGRRKEKYRFLQESDFSAINWQKINWQKINNQEPHYFFVPKDFANQDDYDKGFKIEDLFLVKSSGIKTHDDANLISFVPFSENNHLYAYKPLDIRYINYDLKRIQRPRYNVMKHFLLGDNIGLCIMRSQINTVDFKAVFLCKYLMDINHYGFQTYVFPLYLYSEKDSLDTTEQRCPNLNPDIVNKIAEKINLSFIPEANERKNSKPRSTQSSTEENIEALSITPCSSVFSVVNNIFTPIDILDYIYAVLHSPAYRTQYKEFLKIDFPKVPYPANAEQFFKLAELGGTLRKIHLLENFQPSKEFALYPIKGSNTIDSLTYKDSKVWINEQQYFDAVPPEVWTFYIGGYQPAQKWLKDRKGRTLGFDEIQHYQKIVYALYLTGDLQKRIDGVYTRSLPDLPACGSQNGQSD